jgi:monovalent cation:H+ antiporter-2, CPA2 family
MQEHIILVGWNHKMRHLIDNLPISVKKEKNIICLANLSSQPYNLPDSVSLIQGDPNKEESLKSAFIDTAVQAIIALENDPDTILAAMSAQNLNPDVALTVNIHHSENIKHLERLGIEKIICDEELAGQQMIHSFYNNQHSF